MMHGRSNRTLTLALARFRRALFTPYMRTAGLTLLLLLVYLLVLRAGWL